MTKKLLAIGVLALMIFILAKAAGAADGVGTATATVVSPEQLKKLQAQQDYAKLQSHSNKLKGRTIDSWPDYGYINKPEGGADTGWVAHDFNAY